MGIVPLTTRPVVVGAGTASARRVGQAARGFAVRFPLSQSGQGMAPMHLAAAEAGGSKRQDDFCSKERGWRGRSAASHGPTEIVLRRARGWPLSLSVLCPGASRSRPTARRSKPSRRQNAWGMEPRALPVRSRQAANRRAVVEP